MSQFTKIKSHVLNEVLQVKTSKGLRRLTPVELERLNMFPDGHTACANSTHTKRAFFMGNALVVGIVEGLRKALSNELEEDK